MITMIILFTIGFGYLLWSVKTYRRPESLTQGSYMYRWIARNWSRSQHERGGTLTEPELNPEQIRRYAAHVSIVSGITMVIALVGMIVLLV